MHVFTALPSVRREGNFSMLENGAFIAKVIRYISIKKKKWEEKHANEEESIF